MPLCAAPTRHAPLKLSDVLDRRIPKVTKIEITNRPKLKRSRPQRLVDFHFFPRFSTPAHTILSTRQHPLPDCKATSTVVLPHGAARRWLQRPVRSAATALQSAPVARRAPVPRCWCFPPRLPFDGLLDCCARMICRRPCVRRQAYMWAAVGWRPGSLRFLAVLDCVRVASRSCVL